MKRILSTSLLLVAMVVAFTGCLKDKGFDNHTYGINDPDSQPPGVGFPLGSEERVNVGINAGSTTPQQITNIVFVNIFAGLPAKSDVKVTLQLNDALRVAYNNANGTNILPMNPAHYSIPGLTVTIPAGSLNGQIAITVPNTAILSPNDSYGLGFTIASVDGGYRVADNFKNLFVVISLKNKYDGVYEIQSGFVQRYSAPGVPICCDGLTGPLGPNLPEVELGTTGASSVEALPSAISPVGFTWSAGNGISGIDGLSFNFDASDNVVSAVSVLNPSLSIWGGFTSAPGPFGPPAVNKYDPATKMLHVAFRWNPTGIVREYDVVLKYLRPR